MAKEKSPLVEGVAKKKKPLVFGYGINDATYKLTRYEKIDGKVRQVWICPFYQKWRHILERAYSAKFKEKNPTYQSCTVCEDWLTFSNFKAWMESQNWQGMHLDKDLLKEGNLEYSPETCVFVPRSVNVFLTDRKRFRGDYMLGVSYRTPSGIYIAQCCDLTGFSEVVCRSRDEMEAHLAWKRRKHEHACTLADSLVGVDPRVITALKTRYL